MMVIRRIALVVGALLLLAHIPAVAQAPAAFGTCSPRSERGDRAVGCFIITEQPIGQFGAEPVFWHIAAFASRAQADSAVAEMGAGATVVEAFDTAWVFRIAGADWHPDRGTEIAVIGPLPVTPGVAYSALYMEASMTPGMKSMVHRHSGPEAWYTFAGETCLETPAGTQVGRAVGPPVIVPGGLPMELTATGTAIRKSLVLILHDASQPPTRMETSWKPRGLCSR